MAKLHKKLIRVLQPHLTDLQDALDDLPGGRVSGVLISSSFQKLSFKGRQALLMAILTDKLTERELSDVGAIAALTPAEATVKAI
jgi:hypothetical protein